MSDIQRLTKDNSSIFAIKSRTSTVIWKMKEQTILGLEYPRT